MGRIEAICGPMFSGKSSELLSRIHRATFAKKSVLVFKPVEDTLSEGLETHSSKEWPAINIPSKHPDQILDLVSEVDIVGIDEVQFFDPSVVEVVETLAAWGKRVIVAGLDKDSKGKPFGAMPQLLAVADRIDKLTAVCTECGEDATCSQYLLGVQTAQLDVGAEDKYAARCRNHFTPSLDQ